MSAPRFDVEIQHNGHTLNVTGTETRYRPATGPTMEHAGGEPAEGGELEDLEVVLLWRAPVRRWRSPLYKPLWRRRPLCEAITEAIAPEIEDEIREKLAED